MITLLSIPGMLIVLALLGVLAGLFFVIVGISTIAQTRQITYKKVEKSYVTASIEEYSVPSSNNYPPVDYLALENGSIFYLDHSDFPDSSQLPIIHEHDVISLIYDVNTKRKINESASPDPFQFYMEGTGKVQIEGYGYQIVQLTVGYPDIVTGKPSDQAPASYASNDYVQHPHSYYRNNWVSLTGGGFLAIGIILLVLCPIVFLRITGKPQKMRSHMVSLRYIKWQ